MSVDVHEEERAAQAKLRRVRAAQRAHQKAVAANRRHQLADAIRATKRIYPSCSCSLYADMNRQQLVELGSGCTDHFVCPRLDRVRRVMGI